MGTKIRSYKLNFMMNAILTVSSMIFPLITYRYVSEIILPEGTGRVSFAISLITYFNMFAQLGIPTYGIRACAKVRDDKEELTRTVHELLVINLVMALLSYIVLGVMIAFVPALNSDKALYLIVSSIILLSAIGIEWMYKGLEQYAYITIRALIFKFLALIAMFFVIHEKEDYVMYGAISVFASSASYIINFIHARKYIDFRPVGGYNFKRHLKYVMIFFAMSCATTIYTNLDTVMLGVMTTKTDVGYYDAAVKIKNILVGVVTSLGTVLLPRASYYIEKGMISEFKNISAKALNFVFLISLPFVVYFIIFAKPSIFFLTGGTSFAGAVFPMQIIMPCLFLIGITNILGIQILIPLGREKMVLYSEIAGAVTDLTLNLILIPKLAAAGAAIGTLAAETVVLIVQYIALRDEIRDAFKEIQYWKILIAVLGASGVALLLVDSNFNEFLLLLVSAIIVFGVYFLVLLLTKEKMFWQLFCEVANKVKKGKNNDKR